MCLVYFFNVNDYEYLMFIVKMLNTEYKVYFTKKNVYGFNVFKPIITTCNKLKHPRSMYHKGDIIH